jgi:hypothetical protein
MSETVERAFPGTTEEPGLVKEQDLEYGTASDSLKKLFDNVIKDVHSWRPEPGDVIGGMLIDISDSTEGEFGSYVILTIETPSGRLVSVHCFHTVLRREIERKLERGTLRVGDEIAIMYVGEGEAQGSRSAANLYRVVVNRPQK